MKIRLKGIYLKCISYVRSIWYIRPNIYGQCRMFHFFSNQTSSVCFMDAVLQQTPLTWSLIKKL